MKSDLGEEEKKRMTTLIRAFSEKARGWFYCSSSAILPFPPLIFIVFLALILRLYPLALALFSVLAKQRCNHDASNDRAPNRRTDRRGKYIFSVNTRIIREIDERTTP